MHHDISTFFYIIYIGRLDRATPSKYWSEQDSARGRPYQYDYTSKKWTKTQADTVKSLY